MTEAKKYLVIGRNEAGEEQTIHAKGGHQRDVKKAFLEGGGYEVTVAEVTEEPGVQKEQPAPTPTINPFVGATIFIVCLGILVAVLIGLARLVGDVGMLIYFRHGLGAVLAVGFAIFVAFLFLYALIYLMQNKPKEKKK